MRWFRFYSEVRYDPKIAKLSDRQYRIWTEILCIASEYDGEIPVAYLTHALSYRSDHALRVVGELLDHGLLTYGGGLIIPHNWNGRQYKSDSAAVRMRRYRARRRQTKSDVTQRYAVTAPDKKERKKEREASKWVAELGARRTAEIDPNDLASLRALKPLRGH